MDISVSRFGEFSSTPSLWYDFLSSETHLFWRLVLFTVSRSVLMFYSFFSLTDFYWVIQFPSFVSQSWLPSTGPFCQSLSAEDFTWLLEFFISSTTSVWLFPSNSVSLLIPFSYLRLPSVFPSGLCFCFLGVHSSPLSCSSTVISFLWIFLSTWSSGLFFVVSLLWN